MDVREQAAISKGTSDASIQARVKSIFVERIGRVKTLIDVGCGAGMLFEMLRPHFDRYIGCDVVQYPGFPHSPDVSFVQADLNRPPVDLAEGTGDAVIAVETIEHLENPRAFARELTRLARPGGWLVITTPNQLSLLSKLTLLVKNEFNAFQSKTGYPAHISALLENDLRHIANECEWDEVSVSYSNVGRMPGTNRSWPEAMKGRMFSDNILIVGRRRISVGG